MICTKCGAKFDDNTSVCPNCGTYCGQPSSPGAISSNTVLNKIKSDPKKTTAAVLIAVGIPVLVLLIVLLAVGLAKPKGGAQAESSAAPVQVINPFIGTWSYNTGEVFFGAELVLTFREDKTVDASISLLSASGTYSYEGDDKSGMLTLNIEGVGSYGTGTYKYIAEGDSLSLSDATQTIVFRRVEQVDNEESQE